MNDYAGQEQRLAFIKNQEERQRDLRKLCTYCERPLWSITPYNHAKCIKQFIRGTA
jgi:hypothetical protein